MFVVSRDEQQGASIPVEEMWDDGKLWVGCQTPGNPVPTLPLTSWVAPGSPVSPAEPL